MIHLKPICFALLVSISISLAQQSPQGSGDLRTQNEMEKSERETPSRTKNILYSLILPGAGQWAMGYKGRAKFFMGTEFLLWVGYFGTQSYANVIQRDYHSYASVHAGVNTAQKDEQYWIDIGSADNIYDFNEQRLRDRNKEALYPEGAINYWQWDSKDSRRYYNNLRVKEHNWERRATFVVGAFVLNRLVSAIDVVRIIRKENKSQKNQTSHLHFNYKTTPTGAGVVNLNLTMNW